MRCGPIVLALATALLIGCGNDDGESDRPERTETERTAAAPSALDECVDAWNDERKNELLTAVGGFYDAGVETAFVTQDSDGRCVVAFAPNATTGDVMTFVVRPDGRWAVYASNPPSSSESADPSLEAINQSVEWQGIATAGPNAEVLPGDRIALLAVAPAECPPGTHASGGVEGGCIEGP